MLLWLASLSAGAVEITAYGIDPANVPFVRAALIEGEACTGLPPDVGDTLTLVPVTARTHAGRAHIVNGVVVALELPDNNASVVVHEVAHAWSHGWHASFSEGGAEWLGNCIAARMGRLDVRLVGATRRQESVGTISGMRTGGHYREYSVARVWFGVLARRVPMRELFSKGPAAVAERAADDPVLAAWFDAYDDPNLGPLSKDRDRDGLPEFAEIALGTDPNKEDSNGDGWWDGAEPETLPPHATRLYADDHLHCTGWRGPRSSTPYRSLRFRDRWGDWTTVFQTPDPHGRVVRGIAFDLALWPEDPRGYRPDTRCIEGRSWVVLAEGTSIPTATVQAVAAHPYLAAGGLRTVVRLGTPTTGIVAGEVHISARDTWMALKRQATPQLGILAEVLVGYAELGGEVEAQKVYEQMTLLNTEPPAWRPRVAE